MLKGSNISTKTTQKSVKKVHFFLRSLLIFSIFVVAEQSGAEQSRAEQSRAEQSDLDLNDYYYKQRIEAFVEDLCPWQTPQCVFFCFKPKALGRRQ